MRRTEYITPWVQMRAHMEQTRKAAKRYPVSEPFAPRHSITYFNNNKEDSRESAYKRLHGMEDYDPSKPRCDRTKASLYWSEISKENEGHKVPMTSNHWYGRPNRIQVDVPEKKFNRSSRMQEFYSRCGIAHVLISDSDERQAGGVC